MKKTLTVGETYQLSATVLPNDANQNLTYESYDTDVCTVDESGLVTAVGEGESYVEVTSVGNKSISDTIFINVTAPTGTPTTISKEWDLSATNPDWTASGNEAYFSQPYGFKKANGTLITTSSISDFSKANKTQIVVGFKCLQNGGTSSKITIYLYDSEGNALNSEVFTPINKSDKTQTSYCEATFTTNLTKAAKIGMKVTTFGKNILVNGAKYELTYLDSGTTPSTKTLSKIEVSNPKTSFTVGDTWTFGGTVTATYSDNTTADVTTSVTFKGNTTSTSGTKTVTVSYTEGGVTKSDTYSITVSAPVVTNYTVTFNSNGGSGTMTSETTNGSSYVTPTCSFTKESYTFDKWALNSATGTKYAAGTTINNISSNITLYATWAKNSSTGGEGVQMPSDYYNTITDDLTGETLLSKLRTLNLSKRTSTVGYSNMGTSPSGSYKYTDYDPTTVKYDANGQPYGTAILSFYSGKSCTSWNREHVWPNSRGGGSGGSAGTPYPDADIFMPRPTITEENSDRGNSKYVEGIVSTTAGWDPVTAFEKTLGVYPGIRGECARIIFYCMTVNSNLVLDDTATGGTLGKTMGKLSDLLKWNLENPVNDREVRRQSGGQYLQGNRNAFVDDPGYACRIWGNTNTSTRTICSQQPTTDKVLTDLTVSGSLTKTKYYDGESFSPTGLTITAVFDDDSTLNVTNSITWSPEKLNTGTTSVTGSYTLNGVTKTVTINNLTVTASPTSSITMVTNMSQLSDGDLVYLATGLDDTDVGVTGNGSNNATVSSSISSWKQYTVVKSGTTYKLKDGTQYIGTVSSNGFTYDTTGAAITLDASSNVKVGSRWFVKNGSNYRCYTSLGSYVPFHIYKVPSQSEPKVTALSLNPTSLSFDVYTDMNAKTITANVTADEGADKTITWTSSNETVATVDNGVVTPHAYGSATITAKAGDIEKTCSVQVNDSTPKPVTGVSLNKPTTSLSVGSSETLVATITPENASNKTVTWTSSLPSCVTVDQNGKITAIAAGTATITVTTEEGGFTAFCTVTVTAAPVITYELEADQETVPYMSGTNHQVLVGVKLYKYTNGVKGSQVGSSSDNVDTSVLGPTTISYTYQSVTYKTTVKVTNNGAIQNKEGTSTNTNATFTKQVFSEDGTEKVGDLSLTLQNNGGYYGYESTKGQQVGSGSKPAKSMSLTTSVEGTITKVTVNTSGGSSVSATVSIKVGSTSFKCGTSTSKSITATATSYEFTGSASGDIVISWSQTSSKALYFKSIEITTTTEGTKVFSNEEQATAWSDYFIKLTGGGEFDGPCKLETSEAKKAALQQVWGELKSEYVYMVEGSKTAFCSTDATETIAEAVQHYRYIVNTYGLEDFAEVPQASNSNKFIPISDSEPFIIGVIAMVGLAAIGGYFVYRRRREE